MKPLHQWRSIWASRQPRKLLIKPDVPLFSRSAVAEMRAAPKPLPEPQAAPAANLGVVIGNSSYAYKATPQQGPDWITHDGKGFPAALKGVPPERVMMRFRNGVECAASDMNSIAGWTEPWDASLYWKLVGGLKFACDVAHYSILPEVAKRHWSAWIPHEPGPCPIPWVKAGEWQAKDVRKCIYPHDELRDIPDCVGWGPYGEGTITHYRLLLPEGFTPHDGGERPEEIGARELIDVVISSGEIFKAQCIGYCWEWNRFHHSCRIIGWRKV